MLESGREVIKRHITGISFFYKGDDFNASDLETIMESLKEFFFQRYGKKKVK